MNLERVGHNVHFCAFVSFLYTFILLKYKINKLFQLVVSIFLLHVGIWMLRIKMVLCGVVLIGMSFILDESSLFKSISDKCQMITTDC